MLDNFNVQGTLAVTVRAFENTSKSFATMHLFAITKKVTGFALMCMNKKRLNVGRYIFFHFSLTLLPLRTLCIESRCF